MFGAQHSLGFILVPLHMVRSVHRADLLRMHVALGRQGWAVTLSEACTAHQPSPGRGNRKTQGEEASEPQAAGRCLGYR